MTDRKLMKCIQWDSVKIREHLQLYQEIQECCQNNTIQWRRNFSAVSCTWACETSKMTSTCFWFFMTLRWHSRNLASFLKSFQKHWLHFKWETQQLSALKRNTIQWPIGFVFALDCAISYIPIFKRLIHISFLRCTAKSGLHFHFPLAFLVGLYKCASPYWWLPRA